HGVEWRQLAAGGRDSHRRGRCGVWRVIELLDRIIDWRDSGDAGHFVARLGIVEGDERGHDLRRAATARARRADRVRGGTGMRAAERNLARSAKPAQTGEYRPGLQHATRARGAVAAS